MTRNKTAHRHNENLPVLLGPISVSLSGRIRGSVDPSAAPHFLQKISPTSAGAPHFVQRLSIVLLIVDAMIRPARRGCCRQAISLIEPVLGQRRTGAAAVLSYPCQSIEFGQPS